MPLLFIYLIKLSVSLGVMYLFYQFLLRRLTFYNHNRWYLIGYSLLCFFIPFINISPALEKNEAPGYDILTLIPTVENFTAKVSPALGLMEGLTAWDWLMIALLTGTMIMLIRLIIQFISFKRIKRKARLIADDTIKFYQVDKNIIPFSFGNSIFINQQLHTEAELKEIIRHEFVHVKQRHTIDIIWGEVLCILNWYNPFAWLIRKAIRQNLEFIADNRVLANGMDKKQYQYLLLKVIGNNHFSMVNQFNFSSLKNRIVMMNKMRTTKIHLTRFLFVLPLLAVVLLSFRSVTMNKQQIAEAENVTAELVLPAINVANDPVDGAPLSDTTKPVKKKAPANPPSPVNSVSPVQPAQPPQPLSPVQSAQPVSPVQPKQPAQPKPTIEIRGISDTSVKPLVIVDGEEWPKGLDLSIIDAGKIESMNVLKGESANIYGAKGKHGVIIITTKKDNVRTVIGSITTKKDNVTTVVDHPIAFKNADNAKTVVGSPAKPLYFIDGKPATKEAVDKLEPAKIKSMDVLKGSKAEEKYGEKGKNGVIEIKTITPVPTRVNYIEKQKFPKWDIRDILGVKKKDEC